MITDLILVVVYNLLNFLTGWLPGSSSCSLTGLAGAGTFLSGIIGTTGSFVPWSDMLLMITILLGITGARLIMQVINLLWP